MKVLSFIYSKINDIYPHRSFLNGGQVYRIYLDELGDIRQLPLELAVMLLTKVPEQQAPEEARYLLQRTQQETPQPSSQAIIELITTIITYKFENLSRREVEEMLGITLQETRVYREIKQEGELLLILRQLNRKVGELPQEVRQGVENLSLEQLKILV